MIRVLQVIDKVGYEDRLHGPGRLLYNTLPGFDPQRFEVIAHVLRLGDSLRMMFADRGIHLRASNRSRFNVGVVLDLARVIRRHQIDLVHLHNYGAAAFGRIAALLTGVPAIIHQHDTNLRMPRYVHWVDAILSPATTRAIAVSPAAAQLCIQQRHIPEPLVVVIPNAIEPGWARQIAEQELADLRAQLDIPAGAPVVGTVTRFFPIKNVPLLVEAFTAVVAERDGHLVVVGDGGPDKADVEARIERASLKGRVHLVGFKADVRPYLALMDVVVFSSRRNREGFSIALLEAMAMGKPAVVTDVWGLNEIVDDGVNGLVVPPEDPEALAAAIVNLMRDPSLRRGLGEEARRTVKQYQTAAYIDELQRVYEDVLEDSTVRSRAPSP